MSDKKLKTEECGRCGSCCDKGGPAFHLRDKHLIENKIIPAKYLYTIRKGEPARDNVEEKLIFVDSDIIKIKGQEGSWRCVFMDAESKLCGIYKNRPFECQILNCRNTGEIESSYDKNYLTREDLFAASESLWEMIEEHQRQCSYEKIRDFLNTSKENQESSYDQILKMIERDADIRSLMIEKTRDGFDLSEFMLGGPLFRTIRGFGLELTKSGDGYALSRRNRGNL